jgi:hypothetical protein
MRTRTLRNQVDRLAARLQRLVPKGQPMLDSLRHDPAQIMRLADMRPDAWQEEFLRSRSRHMLLLCSRQAGKSTVAAACALHTALLQPGSPVLVLSPTLRQSGELFRKVLYLFSRLGRPVEVVAENALHLELANGSRILSLPGDEETIRGFSGVALLVIDEAARVDDTLYYAVRPMLAVSQGRLVALSTPFGKRGWFHDEWHGGGDWQRVRVPADDCPRIARGFLKEERRALGERWFRQEYQCSFEESIDAVFAYADIQAALSDDVKPLFPE